MAATYKPTPAEIEAFNRDLTRYVAFVAEEDGGEVTDCDLRELAEAHWPGKNVRLKVDALNIGWTESNPDRVDDKPEQPAVVQVASRPAPLQPLQGHPNPTVEQARRDFQDIYGNQQGAKVITVSDDYARSGQTVDVHLNPTSRGDGGLDEQARRKIDALPKYGDPGWSKRQLTQIRAGAAQRAAAAQQARPGRSEREALAVAAEAAGRPEDSEALTWDAVRRSTGNAYLSEANRAMARRYGQQ
jgi:hypothetical protein